MNEVPRRPFYTEYAWAFDLLIERPVRKECAVIAAWLIDRGRWRVDSGRPGMGCLSGTKRQGAALQKAGLD